ncbi:MAG: TolB protein [Mariprofundaceae bacterium]|nr:TolB protein [Mariprofundaceae bacterium]
MRKHPLTISFMTALVLSFMSVWMPSAQAADVLNWLEQKIDNVSADKPSPVGDGAVLLTLEPHETEMYPKPSPDAHALLVVASKRKQAWISRRYIENGDPANIVTDDARAFDSIGWLDNGHVYFLSERAGGLGLWEKISDGEGMLRRLQEMRGRFTQPVLLSDGSVIAVRLSSLAADRKRRAQSSKHDGFDNWSVAGYRSELVHISEQGTRVLGKGINPALSPDGQWLVFAMAVGRSAHLFRMHPDGSDLIQVTDARSVDVQPSWSADGKWIVFTSNRGHPDMRHTKRSNWDIWAIDAEGRNLTRLTSNSARDGGAKVGNDGRVYFHSDRKVGAKERAAREIDRVQQGFHIWSVALPSSPGR